MSDTVKHYMWKDGESDNSPTGTKDIEVRFPGIKYSKCVGLNSRGKRKNVHIEKLSDRGELKVWQDPEKVLREATDITFSFYFTGVNRQAVYDSFMDYIGNGKINYWDTVRKKHAYMIFVDQAKPKEDVYKGSVPYILVELKMQNLWGECPTKEATEF